MQRQLVVECRQVAAPTGLIGSQVRACLQCLVEFEVGIMQVMLCVLIGDSAGRKSAGFSQQPLYADLRRKCGSNGASGAAIAPLTQVCSLVTPRVQGLHPHPPCGWWGCFGASSRFVRGVVWGLGVGLRVSSWARRRPKPWPIRVSVATLDTPRSCIASKATTLTKIAGSGGVTVGPFEKTVTTLTRISGVYHGGTIPWGGWGGGLLTRNTAPYIRRRLQRTPVSEP